MNYILAQNNDLLVNLDTVSTIELDDKTITFSFGDGKANRYLVFDDAETANQFYNQIIIKLGL